MFKIDGGDIGKEKERRIMVPVPEPSEAPVKEPAIEPEPAVEPELEPVPA